MSAMSATVPIETALATFATFTAFAAFAAVPTWLEARVASGAQRTRWIA